MNEQEIALDTVVRAMITCQYDGQVHSIAQLASLITKASRFLFEREARYTRGTDDRNAVLEREAAVLIALAREFVDVARKEGRL